MTSRARATDLVHVHPDRASAPIAAIDDPLTAAQKITNVLRAVPEPSRG